MMLTSRIAASLTVVLIGAPSISRAQDISADYQRVLTTLGNAR